MLKEDLKIIAEECGFLFFVTDNGAKGVEAQDWDCISLFANRLINMCVDQLGDSQEYHALSNFIDYRLGDDFRRLGIRVNKRGD